MGRQDLGVQHTRGRKPGGLMQAREPDAIWAVWPDAQLSAIWAHSEIVVASWSQWRNEDRIGDEVGEFSGAATMTLHLFH